MARLVVYRGGKELMRRELTIGTQLRIGRSSENEIVLDDDRVSRRHARLEVHDGGFTLFDLGGENGTYVDGERKEKDFIDPWQRIGIHDFELRIEDDEGRPTVPANEEGATVPVADDTGIDGTAPGDDVPGDEAVDNVPTMPRDQIVGALVTGDRLEVIESAGDVDNGRQFGVKLGTEYRIGRADDCDIVLKDRSVSRHHARLVIPRRGRGYAVVNWQSGHGTFFRDREIYAMTRLNYDDVIQLGNTKLKLKKDPTKTSSGSWVPPKPVLWSVGAVALAAVLFFTVVMPWLGALRLQSAQDEFVERVDAAQALYANANYADADAAYDGVLAWLSTEYPDTRAQVASNYEGGVGALEDFSRHVDRMRRATSAFAERDGVRVIDILGDEDLDRYQVARDMYDTAKEWINVDSVLDDAEDIIVDGRATKGDLERAQGELAAIERLVSGETRSRQQSLAGRATARLQEIARQEELRSSVARLETAYAQADIDEGNRALESLIGMDLGEHAARVDLLHKCLGHAGAAKRSEKHGDRDEAEKQWRALAQLDPGSPLLPDDPGDTPGSGYVSCSNEEANEACDQGMSDVAFRDSSVSEAEQTARAIAHFERAVSLACDDEEGRGIREKANEQIELLSLN